LRWQLASSAINAVTSAATNAVSHIEDLDKSLNNIRIVTGKGAEEMARFAKEANKMAKELGTATTEYTNASLIYYQ
jgi:DNA/RNA-binding domain of Phe-tRNA-synthetase-like protein